jgi:hypothetical protein
LEHATIRILNRRFPYLRFAGWSVPGGFYVYGAITTSQLEAAISEAVARLSAGEHHLAVHPNCGTNIVTAGMLVGFTSFVSMLPGDQRARRTRLPLVLLLSTFALLLAQPLGLAVQQHVTTEANLSSVSSISIERLEFRATPLYRVRLEHNR